MARHRCDHPANAFLAWYVNGSLEGEEECSVREHIDGCETCSSEIEFLSAVARTVRERKTPAARAVWIRPAAAVAASLMFVAAFATGWFLNRPVGLSATAVLDLKGGPTRTDAVQPKVVIPPGVDSVAIRFLVPGDPGSAYRIELRRDAEVVLMRDEPRLPFDSSGRCTYTVAAELLGSPGPYELLLSEMNARPTPRVYRFPFRVERPDDAARD